MSRRWTWPHWRDAAILSLLLSGWVVPSTFPPYGVVFGSNGLPRPDLYHIDICVGAGGWFSKAVVVERTWEWTHGHSWPVGPWIPGSLVSLCVPVSAGLIVCSRVSRALVAIAWGCISIWLTATWLEPYSSVSQYGWRTYVLLSVFAGYWFLLSSLWFWSGRLDRAQRIYLVAKNSLFMYPLWILALTTTQGICPFVGWGFTSAGCIVLALRWDTGWVCDRAGAGSLK